MNVSNRRYSYRRSIRLKDVDYTQPGAYFVTMVTYQRHCLFGEVVDGEVQLNQYGQVVAQTWEWLPVHFQYICLDPYVVMPNHFHGILKIVELDDPCRGGSRPAPTKSKKYKPLGELIGVFKTISAKEINHLRCKVGSPVWQRNYYEHIVRNQTELENIALYILSNPSRWAEDPEYIP